MVFTEVGMMIEVREVQERKAWKPMLVTNVGIKTEMTEVHPSKALSGMEVIALGVVIADCPQQLSQIE